MNKKGALELGINTVVILVIALVVIAGGIAFITGVFDNLGKVGTIKMPDFPATANEPLVFSNTEPVIKMGTKDNLDVNVYNRLSSDKEITVVFGKCTSDVANPGCEVVAPVLVALPQTIISGESSGFKTLMTAKCASDTSKKLVPGQYVCSFKAVTTETPAEVVGESQIIITVTS